jgi:transcription elongation GreA/GreB family factor
MADHPEEAAAAVWIAGVAVCDPVADRERAVRVGDVVHVQDGQLDEWWRIVPSGEADAMKRLISEETPLARALLGHRAGEVVRVRAPGAPQRGWPVTILDIGSPGAWD